MSLSVTSQRLTSMQGLFTQKQKLIFLNQILIQEMMPQECLYHSNHLLTQQIQLDAVIKTVIPARKCLPLY